MAINANYVIDETIKKYSILLAAPGASKKNTKIHTDKGPADGRSSVFVKVGNPEVEEAFLENVDFGLDLSFCIPAQYDIGTVRATVKNGLVLIRVSASDERIAEVHLEKE